MIGLEGATCNTALIPEMEEIGANILLAEHIGRALVVGSEPADRLDVDVPGPLGKAGKPHVVDHTLTQRGHGRSPFGFKRQDLCPGTDQIPQHAVLNDYAFYGEAVQSNARLHRKNCRNRYRRHLRRQVCAALQLHGVGVYQHSRWPCRHVAHGAAANGATAGPDSPAYTMSGYTPPRGGERYGSARGGERYSRRHECAGAAAALCRQRLVSSLP